MKNVALPKLKLPKSKRFIVLGLLLVLAVVLLGAVGYHQVQRSHTKCPDKVLTEALRNFDAADQTAFDKLVANIRKTKGYETDQNCLYVIMKYDVRTSNAADAKKTFASLSKIYDSEKGFSPKLGDKRDTMQALKARLVFLEAQEKEFRDNAFGVPLQ